MNKGTIDICQEPLHFYEPSMSGWTSGLTFIGELKLDKSGNRIPVLLFLLPVGGSPSPQWLNDSIHREVNYFSNFKQSRIGMRFGKVKGIPLASEGRKVSQNQGGSIVPN